jgi:hypothetical protein
MEVGANAFDYNCFVYKQDLKVKLPVTSLYALISPDTPLSLWYVPVRLRLVGQRSQALYFRLSVTIESYWWP